MSDLIIYMFSCFIVRINLLIFMVYCRSLNAFVHADSETSCLDIESIYVIYIEYITSITVTVNVLL